MTAGMRKRIGVICVVASAIAAPHAMAQEDTVVQLKDDPYRRIAVENAMVRVWAVMIPVGRTTPFHEHKIDMVAVRINGNELTNVPKGGLFNFTTTTRVEPGSVSFAEYTKSPYIHSITPKGPLPHHVIEMEILGGASAEPDAEPSDRLGFTTIVDNSRIRAARLFVAPGQSADVLPRKNTLLVVVKGGTTQPKELKAGDFEWHSDAAPRSIRNDGPTPLELVEVVVK